MMTSINKSIDDDGIRVIIEEMDEREEMICLWYACGAAANLLCLGQACAAACIGITVCLAGLHTL